MQADPPLTVAGSVDSRQLRDVPPSGKSVRSVGRCDRRAQSSGLRKLHLSRLAGLTINSVQQKLSLHTMWTGKRN
jgi:hypothetical protein